MTHTIQWDEITDPLVFINLLKIFFSELKSPLCGAHNYERFVEIVGALWAPFRHLWGYITFFVRY